MIGFLAGTVKYKFPDSIILSVSGVGYQVFVGSNRLDNLQLGSELELFIYTHVREDALELFGLATATELNLFKLLIGVSGVGAKTALAVLTKGEAEIKHAIDISDVDFFTTVPRLGRKNAQKIIIDLKSKLGSLADFEIASIDQTAEISMALTSLGYSKAEILSAIKLLPAELTNTDAKIKQVIKLMGQK